MPKSKNNRNNTYNIFSSKGITLIALIITIIVILILAGITLNFVFGENGVIDRSIEADFKTRFTSTEEKVKLYILDQEAGKLISQIQTSSISDLPVSNKLSVSEIEGLRASLKKEIQELSGIEDVTTVNLYNIDNEKIDSKYRYIIDADTRQLYDVEGAKYSGKYHHTLSGQGYDNVPGTNPTVVDQEKKTIEGDVGWYSPNMNGFDSNYTYLIYYNEDNLDESKEIPVTEYIENGKQNSITENGKKYVLDKYTTSMWANCKTTATGLEAWWVWIPRYAYSIDQDKKEMKEIIFVDLANKPIGTKYDSLPEGYIVHPAFTQSGNLQGIWMSKFEPSNRDSASRTLSTDLCYAPDMTGFDAENTYIELLSEDEESFDEVLLKNANLASINNDKKWYSYSNNKWANVKTIANELEAWWVWIPRYAYYMNPASNEVEIIFVDLDNKPFEKELYGNTLPKEFIVHSAFTPSGEDGSKNLKGIWMSKYEPSKIDSASRTKNTDLCYAPDMTGFDAENTYIELLSEDEESFDEVLLKNANLASINNDKRWYSYSNNKWANVKTIANEIEAWWVWVPRYAYYMNPATSEVDIIFIDLDNKPLEPNLYGDTLPDEFIVHPAFTPSGGDGSKNLKGIWMSKYEPSEVEQMIGGE